MTSSSINTFLVTSRNGVTNILDCFGLGNVPTGILNFTS